VPSCHGYQEVRNRDHRSRGTQDASTVPSHVESNLTAQLGPSRTDSWSHAGRRGLSCESPHVIELPRYTIKAGPSLLSLLRAYLPQSPHPQDILSRPVRLDPAQRGEHSGIFRPPLSSCQRRAFPWVRDVPGVYRMHLSVRGRGAPARVLSKYVLSQVRSMWSSSVAPHLRNHTSDLVSSSPNHIKRI
jgi:hypothetical protein